MFRLNDSFSNQDFIYDILLIIIIIMQFSIAEISLFVVSRILLAVSVVVVAHKIWYILDRAMNKNNKLNISTYCLDFVRLVSFKHQFMCAIVICPHNAI